MEHDAAAQQMEQLSRDFAACGKGFYTKLDLGIVKYHFSNRTKYSAFTLFSFQSKRFPSPVPQKKRRAPHGMKYSAVCPGIIPFP